jgi:hypothetical protein
MKPVICCLLFIVAWVPLAAQRTDSTRTSTVETLFYVQGHFYNWNSTNRDLTQIGYPNLDSDLPNFGIAWRKPLSNNKRWLAENALEYSRASANWFDATDQSRDVNFLEWAYSSRILYDVRPGKLTQIFPFAGFGLRYQRLRLYEGITPNIGQLTQGDFSRITLIEWPFHFELGLSVEQGIRFKHSEWFLGMRGGFLAMLRSEWALDGDYPVDLSTPNAGVPFVGFTLRIRNR